MCSFWRVIQPAVFSRFLSKSVGFTQNMAHLGDLDLFDDGRDSPGSPVIQNHDPEDLRFEGMFIGKGLQVHLASYVNQQF